MKAEPIQSEINNVEIVIFAHSSKDFDLCERQLQSLQNINTKIHFCNSKTETRLNFLKKHPGQWLLFLDSDCVISKDIFDQLGSSHISKDQVLAGFYQNPKQSTYLQQVHNFIANTWLNSSYEKTEGHRKILGGAFLIFSDAAKINNISAEKEKFWGAEDKLLAKQLIEVGFNLTLKKDFAVEHNTSKDLKHFIRRAWLQGYNDNLTANMNQNRQGDPNKNFKYWLSELAKINPSLWPAVLVHFSILQLGKLFQKVRRPHNKS